MTVRCALQHKEKQTYEYMYDNVQTQYFHSVIQMTCENEYDYKCIYVQMCEKTHENNMNMTEFTRDKKQRIEVHVISRLQHKEI